jgi:CheY-like chemotaxis protein
MKECPVCKSRYDTSVMVCFRDGSSLADILITTYPNPEIADQQKILSELQQMLKSASLSNDLKQLRECYIQLAGYYHRQDQLNQALAYYNKAELLEVGNAHTTQLPAIAEIYLQQSRTDKAIDLARRIAHLYGRAGLRDRASEYFKRLISMRSTDLRWIKEILTIIEESGLTSEIDIDSNALSDDEVATEYVVTTVEEDESPSYESKNLPLIKGDEIILLEEPEAPITRTILRRATLGGATPNPIVKDIASGQDDRSIQVDERPASGTSFEQPSIVEQRSVRASGSFSPVSSNSGSYRTSGDSPRSSGSYRVSNDTSKFPFSDQLVMIVDDDAGVRDLISEMLIEIGCNVVTATDGEDAIERLQTIHPSFIVSDVMMPRRDGYSLFEYLQNNERLSDIPFIFLTVRGEMDEKLRALEIGVEDYWIKPFDVEELNIRLRRVLQKVRLAGDVRGRLSEMPLPDLLQSLASGNKSGILHLARSGRAGVIYIEKGRIIDAEFEDLTGKTAIYCLINWCMEGGSFNFHSQPIDRDVVIKQSIQGILMEAMRRHDEEIRLIEQLPPGDVFMSVNVEDNPDFFSTDFSDETTRIIQLFDGTHSLKECLRCLEGDLETIQTVVALNKAGLLRIVDFGIQ